MNIDDFFEEIDSRLKLDKFKDCSSPVFRGHSKGGHELLPTLIRDYSKTGTDLWDLENNLYCDFRSLVGPRVKFDSSWETVFAMRHEGIPTRLLDWTENIGTALFFAFDSGKLDNPHIWILNPFKLNDRYSELGGLVSPEEDLEEYHSTYGNRCNDSTIKIKEYPIAIYPRRSNDRIFAQRGLFTIHGTNEEKMETTCNDCLEKVEIPMELVEKLRRVLRQFGINKYSVYPDFKGLSEHLKGIYGY